MDKSVLGSLCLIRRAAARRVISASQGHYLPCWGSKHLSWSSLIGLLVTVFENSKSLIHSFLSVKSIQTINCLTKDAHVCTTKSVPPETLTLLINNIFWFVWHRISEFDTFVYTPPFNHKLPDINHTIMWSSSPKLPGQLYFICYSVFFSVLYFFWK